MIRAWESAPRVGGVWYRNSCIGGDVGRTVVLWRSQRPGTFDVGGGEVEESAGGNG